MNLTSLGLASISNDMFCLLSLLSYVKNVRTISRSALQIGRPDAMMAMIEAGDDDVNGIQSTDGFFHPNLWDNDFIQFLTVLHFGGN